MSWKKQAFIGVMMIPTFMLGLPLAQGFVEGDAGVFAGGLFAALFCYVWSFTYDLFARLTLADCQQSLTFLSSKK